MTPFAFRDEIAVSAAQSLNLQNGKKKGGGSHIRPMVYQEYTWLKSPKIVVLEQNLCIAIFIFLAYPHQGGKTLETGKSYLN